MREKGFRPSVETEKKFETTEARTAEEVQKYFDFADPILGVDWGEYGPPEEYTPEYIAAHPDYTQVFVMRDEKGEIIAGSKVKKIDEETRTRLGLDMGEYADRAGVLLEYTVVQKELQNKGLLQELTKKRVDWARENKSEYVCAEVEITRPVSAWTKIRDGFVMVGLKEPGEGIPEPYFVAVKPLTEQKKEVGENKPEWKEVVVSEETKEELKRMFEDGWIGVDVKFDNEEGPMTLILEK